MKKGLMNRRQFLKTLYGFTLGVVGLYVLRLLSVFTGSSDGNRSSLKKAQFYSRGNHLAG